jgi:hypothetical protein
MTLGNHNTHIHHRAEYAEIIRPDIMSDPNLSAPVIVDTVAALEVLTHTQQALAF